jgi:Ser/Thr protein kinase RdoA (MazF antagonist)
MSIFPTQYSTLDASALGAYIGQKYGFTALTCRLLVRNVSDTYILSDRHNRYIFKLYRDAHRKRDEIRGEIELLQLLQANNIGVAAPIPDSTGNTIQQFQAAEGMRNGVLFEFAKGKAILLPTDKQLVIIGRELAALHNVTANHTLCHPRISYDTYTTLERPLEIIATRFAELPEEYAFLKKLAAATAAALQKLDPASFSYGICHYDFMPKNFHLDENDRLTIFDFDWAGYGYLANDLMVLCFQYFFVEKANLITREEADRCLRLVLQGYRQHRTIQAAELAAIPHLGAMFLVYGLGFYEDNFDDFSNTFLTQRFLRDRVRLIRQWMELPPPTMS